MSDFEENYEHNQESETDSEEDSSEILDGDFNVFSNISLEEFQLIIEKKFLNIEDLNNNEIAF